MVGQETDKTARGIDWVVGAACVLAVALLLGLHAARIAFPTENDPTYYAVIARQLATGHGLREPLVWHFLNDRVSSVPHPAFDYWMPLPTFFIAFTIWLGGARIGVEAIAPIGFGLLAVALTYLLVLRETKSRLAAAGVALLFGQHTWLVNYATITDSVPFYLGCWLLGITLFLYGKSRVAHLFAGVAFAATALSRGDGSAVLVFALPLYWVWRRLRPVEERVPVAAMRDVVIGIVAVFVLWSLRCVFVLGTPWNPATSRTMWVIRYEQLYEYPPTSSLKTYLAWYSQHLSQLWREKVAGIDLVKRKYLGVVDEMLWVPVAIGWVIALRRRIGFLHIGAILAATTGFSLGILATQMAKFSMDRSRVLFVPFFFAAVAEFAFVVPSLFTKKDADENTVRRARGIGIAAFAAFALFTFGSRLYTEWTDRTPINAAAADQYRALEKSLAQLGIPHDAPIMTAQPWQLTYATGRPSVMTPSERYGAICEVAKRFSVRWLAAHDYGYPPPELRATLRGGPPPKGLVPLANSAPFTIFELRCD